MIVAIIQARLSSTRLKNKVFLPLAEKPLLYHVVHRLKGSKFINKIVVATTVNSEDDAIENWCLENKVKCFRGSQDDVLNRFYNTALKEAADVIVRITADDPFKDCKIIDNCIQTFLSKSLDLVSNNNPPSFPEGMDVEVFSFNALKTAELNAISDFDREHVTQYFYKNTDKFKISNVSYVKDLSSLRWTIDELPDYELARIVYEKLWGKNKHFGMCEILELIEEMPELRTINTMVTRSTMYKNGDNDE